MLNVDQTLLVTSSLNSQSHRYICSIVGFFFFCCILVKVIYHFASHRVSVVVKITASTQLLNLVPAHVQKEKVHGAERA